MIRLAVCDDEKVMRNEIADMARTYFTGTDDELHIMCFADGQSLLESGEEFDLVFLDIQMDGLSGIETARRLRLKSYEGILIFITVLRECVFEAFEAEPFDYLVKPLCKEQFGKTMDRARKRICRSGSRELIVRRGNEYRVIPLKDIVYLESINRKIYVHTKKNEVIDYYFKMEDLEQKLDVSFYRCHRSYCINLAYVRGYSDGFAQMIQGERIPVSRLKVKEFPQIVLNYLKEKG